VKLPAPFLKMGGILVVFLEWSFSINTTTSLRSGGLGKNFSVKEEEVVRKRAG
jgi:hypothetical protein